MNSQIVRLYVVILLLFTGLVVFSSRWAVLEAEELESNPDNRRLLIQEQQIERGTITTSDGVLIAESNPAGGEENPNQRVFIRNYPQGTLFGNPIGYSFVEVERSGIELSENDLLSGDQNEFATLIDQISGSSREGADITLTLDAEAQRVATQALQAAIDSTPGAVGGGSVVAIEPDTGAVRVMASVPGFDPNTVKSPEALKQLNSDDVAAPLVNRPTQSRYSPGSTMKVLTAAAALDSGEFETSTTLDATSGQDIGGVPLDNAGSGFGTIDMTTALTNSVNVYWAKVGEELGQETYYEYMERFGFNADPKLDYPPDSMTASGVVDLDATPPEILDAATDVDIGRVAIGQERLLTTPLQMAQVAATIANEGTLMEPTFLQEAKDPDGRVIEELDPNEQNDAVSEETAAQVTEMMVNVANEGTASGLTTSLGQLAGKTGTAEINVEAGTNRAWFIGFAPAEDPQIAVAAMIEQCTGCFGGEVAGPIATQVMDSLGD